MNNSWASGSIAVICGVLLAGILSAQEGAEIAVDGCLCGGHRGGRVMITDGSHSYIVSVSEKQLTDAGVKRRGDKVRVKGRRLSGPEGAYIPEFEPPDIEATSIELLEANKPTTVEGEIVIQGSSNSARELQYARKVEIRLPSDVRAVELNVQTKERFDKSNAREGDKLKIACYVFQNVIFEIESVEIAEKLPEITLRGTAVDAIPMRGGTTFVGVGRHIKSDADGKIYGFREEVKGFRAGDKIEITGYPYRRELEHVDTTDLIVDMIEVEKSKVVDAIKTIVVKGRGKSVAQGSLSPCGPGWALIAGGATYELNVLLPFKQREQCIEDITAGGTVEVTGYPRDPCPRCKCVVLDVASTKRAESK